MADRSYLRRRIEALLQAQEVRSLDLIRTLQDEHPEDVAEVLREFTPDARAWIVQHLTAEDAAIVLEESDQATRRVLVQALSPENLGDVLDEMGPDEGADILELLPRETHDRVLAEVDDDHATAIRAVQDYHPHTAGGIMTPEVVRVREDETAAEAIRAIQGAVDAEMTNEIQVVDTHGVLTGLVSVRDLICAAPQTPVRDFMERDVIYCTTDVDQEEVVRLADKYNLASVPVVDEDRRLKGIVTYDDILDIAREEVSEDMLLMSGTRPAETAGPSLLRRVRVRLPWLTVTLLGEVSLTWILSRYHLTLEKQVALAFFMPVIAAMGGNVGTQGATIVVRGLATGEIGPQRLRRIFSREIGVGAMLGTIFGLLLAIVGTLLTGSPGIGVVAGMSMLIGMVVSASVGTLLPALLERAGIDPAIASGPFITCVNDVGSITLYLTIATFALPYL